MGAGSGRVIRFEVGDPGSFERMGVEISAVQPHNDEIHGWCLRCTLQQQLRTKTYETVVLLCKTGMCLDNVMAHRLFPEAMENDGAQQQQHSTRALRHRIVCGWKNPWQKKITFVCFSIGGCCVL